jgi:hypothetical protein
VNRDVPVIDTCTVYGMMRNRIDLNVLPLVQGYAMPLSSISLLPRQVLILCQYTPIITACQVGFTYHKPVMYSYFLKLF